MPELPELEIVREVLERRLAGRIIAHVTIDPKGGPLVVRDLTGRGFGAGLVGEHIQVSPRGKYLLFHLSPSRLVAPNSPAASSCVHPARRRPALSTPRSFLKTPPKSCATSIRRRWASSISRRTWSACRCSLRWGPKPSR
jgi:hypothetical protein